MVTDYPTFMSTVIIYWWARMTGLQTQIETGLIIIRSISRIQIQLI